MEGNKIFRFWTHWPNFSPVVGKIDLLVIFLHFCQKIVNDTQKLERFHDANLEVVIMTATGATSDDKVSIMMSYISVYLACTRYQPYRYRPRDRIATILWTTYSNVFSCMKMAEFLLKFHWSELTVQCLPFYIINEVGHLTTFVDHLAEFCQNYHLAAIFTQLMVKFFLQLRFIQYFDCKCMKIPDFSRIDSHFVA